MQKGQYDFENITTSLDSIADSIVSFADIWSRVDDANGDLVCWLAPPTEFQEGTMVNAAAVAAQAANARMVAEIFMLLDFTKKVSNLKM